MNAIVVEGDLLDQPVEVIVNAWNRNVIPWWLLLPQGVSGPIKRRGGTGQFKELSRLGPIPLGGAVLTPVGRLPFEAIIHVAEINLLWRASERSIRDRVRNSLNLAQEQGFRSIAFPLIGAGPGGFNRERVTGDHARRGPEGGRPDRCVPRDVLEALRSGTDTTVDPDPGMNLRGLGGRALS
jgi:O-acetyl-ADP-ribose deacetylase